MTVSHNILIVYFSKIYFRAIEMRKVLETTAGIIGTHHGINVERMNHGIIFERGVFLLTAGGQLRLCFLTDSTKKYSKNTN